MYSELQKICLFFSWDYLEVHDGDNMNAPLVGETYYCGTEIPSIMESTGHSMFLKFKTDYHMTAKGFQIEVEAGRYFLDTLYFFCF